MNWAEFIPTKAENNILKVGETFTIAAIGLDHGHIYGMCQALIDCGAKLKYVFDSDIAKCETFKKRFPDCIIADSEEMVLSDENINLICGACIPNERASLGIRCMEAGKDYFTDKTPLTSLSQLEMVKEAVKRTGRKYMCYYSERIHSEAGEFASQLIKAGAIGDVIHIDGFGPHRIGELNSRPDWFYIKKQYGGILCDIGSHQIEQFLHYTGNENAEVQFSRIGNYAHSDYPELDDYGDCELVGENGATMHFRVDWFTPRGLRTWGDGRTFIVGTDGYIEMRKYCQVGADNGGTDHIYMVNHDGEFYYNARGKTGFSFFPALIRDCLDRTNNAMTQAHTLKAAELCVKAQMMAVKVK